MEYSYDLNGHASGETYTGSTGVIENAITYSHDEMERLESITNTSSVTSFVYDVMGNLTDTTDAAWNSTTKEYDKLNRLVRFYDAAYNKTVYTYNVNDDVTRVKTPRNVTTNYVYDDFGNLLEEQSPDRGVTIFQYDEMGNVASKTDARGIASSYTYDLLGRIKSISYLDVSENVTYTYDACSNGIGHICSVTNASGETDYAYDYFGDITQVIRNDGITTNTTGFIYDSAGRVIYIIYPGSSRVNRIIRLPNGKISSVFSFHGSAQNIVDNRTYRADGQLLSQQFGNGISESRTYYDTGNVETINSGPLSLDYTYDDVGNIQTATDPSSAASYSYDELYRLTEENSDIFSLTFGYDASGNRRDRNDDLNSKYLTYRYTQYTNRLKSINNGSVFGYDDSGNMISYTTPGKSWSAEYNQSGRLKRIYVSGELKAEYNYNAFGQRTRKVVYSSGQLDSAINYFYDLNGNLISEINDQGVPIKEYAWVEDIPIAMFDYSTNSAGEIYYVHADNIGTPRTITNNSGVEVWRWNKSAFGRIAPEEDPDGDGQVINNNLRLPGQYYDSETSLFYNYYRYYDPETGRYITSDPIGLEGGINTYAYAFNNPLKYTDPLGLNPYLVGRPLQGAAGNYAGHMYIVSNANYIGDPNASVYSYGKSNFSKRHGRMNVTGLTGRVDFNTNGFSQTTHSGDIQHWRNLGNNSCNVNNPTASPIPASDAEVDRWANNLLPTHKYLYPVPFIGRLDAVNSNSSAQAVANRSSGSNVPLPSGPQYGYPGASQWSRVRFR